MIRLNQAKLSFTHRAFLAWGFRTVVVHGQDPPVSGLKIVLRPFVSALHRGLCAGAGHCLSRDFPWSNKPGLGLGREKSKVKIQQFLYCHHDKREQNVWMLHM